MANLVTGIRKDYNAKTWTILEALRELEANKKDAEARGKSQGETKYFPRTERLEINSYGPPVAPGLLAMGGSEAANFSNNIGQFGEGLMLSLATLARLVEEGALSSVRIENGDQAWVPVYEHHPDWDCEVLIIKTRKIKYRPGFFVTLEGVDAASYRQLKLLFLETDPDYTGDYVKPEHFVYDRVLMDEALVGRIYVKGVYVRSRPDLSYGYDLDMELIRDRKMMDEWDLKWKLQKLLSLAVKRDPERFQDAFLAALESGEGLEFSDAHAFLYESNVVDLVVQTFEAKHGENAIPVANMAEAQEIHALGGTAIVVSRSMQRLIENQRGSLEERTRRARMAAKTTYSWADLDKVEQDILSCACQLVNRTSLVENSEDVLKNLKIVDFVSDNMLGRHTKKASCSGMGEVLLARKILTNFQTTLKTLIHEVAHRRGTDGAEEHYDAMEACWADIVTTLMVDKVTGGAA